MKTLLLLLPCIIAAAQAQSSVNDSMRVYYVGRAVGWERYSLTPGDSGQQYSADLDYVDRGRRNHLQASAWLHADWSPATLNVERLADTGRSPVLRVIFSGTAATVTKGGQVSTVSPASRAFAFSQYTPVSQHLLLLRHWISLGKPKTLDAIVGADVNRVSIVKQGTDTLAGCRGRACVILSRYAIEGLIWGTEYAWFTDRGELAAFAAAGGGLSFKEIKASLDDRADDIMRLAARAAIRDLTAQQARVRPIASGAIALVGATVIAGTADPAIADATVIVRAGHIVAVGPRATTVIPRGSRLIDVRGKTVMPGLWDMHAHLHQKEWIPTYLAAGVTTVRDMGNELAFIEPLRSRVNSGAVTGPRVLAAGLVDGIGPNAFGALSAATPEEGRAIVRRYHAFGFEQMKLYSLLSPAVVAAICDEAHKLGMTVTGHIPNALSLLAAVDSGMDQVAHLPLRGDPQSDSVKAVIDHLRLKGTVIDPTASWSEIGGHSMSEPIESFQPDARRLPATFTQFRVANWGARIDTATAHLRLARTLTAVRALHEAGIPIVAGTDEGVPGFSVYREIELYVQAGFTNLDAIRAATSVPARAMHLDATLGTLQPGRIADLLILDANPLDEISNIRSISRVMRAGNLYDAATLWTAAGFRPR